MLGEIANEQMDEVHKPVVAAGLILGNEVADALDAFFIDNDTVKLNKFIILAMMEFTQQWESWIEGIKYPDFDHKATKVLHEILLRHSKGIIKALRIWRTDIRK